MTSTCQTLRRSEICCVQYRNTHDTVYKDQVIMVMAVPSPPASTRLLFSDLRKELWQVGSSFMKLSGNLSSFCRTCEAAVYTQ